MSDLTLRCARKKEDALVVTCLSTVALLDIDNDDEEPGYKDARVALKWSQADSLAALLRARIDQERGTFTLTFTREEFDRLILALYQVDGPLFERLDGLRVARGLEPWDRAAYDAVTEEPR